MAEKIINELIKNYEEDMVMLDGLLQWAMNPTSMTAGYGIEANYPYIERNLKIAHDLTSSEAKKAIEKLKTDCDKLMELKQDKYDIDNFRKIIKDDLSKQQYIKLFKNFFLKKKKKSSENAIRFLNIFKNCPIKNYSCINVQYNAIYGEELPEDDIIRLGILKPLYWISSGSSGDKEIIPKFLPFIDDILDNLKLKKWRPEKPKVKEFLNHLINKHDLNTLNFLKLLFERNEICTLEYKKNLRITPKKGFIGIFSSPNPEFQNVGISFLIHEQLFKLIEEYIAGELLEKTQKIIEILEYEIKHEEQPSNKEIVRQFDVNIDEIEEYEKLINELPFNSFSDNQDIKNKASEAIKQFDEPSLYDLLNTLQFDIKTARMVGKYLIDTNMIDELLRVPKEIASSTSLKSSSSSLKYEEIICNNCKTPLSDRKDASYCPYCGSSNIIKI